MVRSGKFNLFKGAEELWDLPKLYRHLARAKREAAPQARQGLSDTEQQDLRGLLCGYSPAEIAKQTCRQSRTVEVRLSQRLYRYVEVLTERPRNSLKYWWHVKEWLEAAGYKMQFQAEAKREQSLDGTRFPQSDVARAESCSRDWVEKRAGGTISGWFKGKLQAEFLSPYSDKMSGLSGNQWHLVGMTWMGQPTGRVQFYVDGDLVREEPYSFDGDERKPLFSLFSVGVNTFTDTRRRKPDRQTGEKSDLYPENGGIQVQDLRLYQRVLVAQDFRRMMAKDDVAVD